MKALTISQPWADIIASGVKWVENRTWRTDYRGPLAIHAGKHSRYLTDGELRRHPTGCVIAIADLVACLPIEGLRQAPLAARIDKHTVLEILNHEYTEGPWCWLLDGVRRIQPVPAKGAQGLWNWEPGIVVEL